MKFAWIRARLVSATSIFRVYVFEPCKTQFAIFYILIAQRVIKIDSWTSYICNYQSLFISLI